jgi:hypothetical protein
MLTLYLIAVAFGGTLLAASLVLGGKDADADASGDADGDADGFDKGGLDKGSAVGVADALAWLPVASLRFWTFFLAFGGGVGAALTYAGSPSSKLVVGATAFTVGWLSGVGAVAVVRALSKNSVDSATSTAELVGSTGELLLGLSKDQPGKVRLDVKGRVQDFVAVTDDESALPTGARVMVVSTHPGGQLVVTRETE